MTKVEYLSRAAVIGRKIKKLETNIGYYRALACAPTSSVSSGERVSHSRNTSAPFERMVIKIAELEEKLNELKAKQVEYHAEIMSAIETLDNEDYKSLLILRYLNDMEWEQVAANLHVSIATVYRWNRTALRKLIVNDSR